MSNTSDIEIATDQMHRKAKSLATRPERQAVPNREVDWYNKAKDTIAITEHDGPSGANRRRHAWNKVQQ